VTLCRATWRDKTPIKPVSPDRTPIDIPSCGYVPGDFTPIVVMLMIRPKPRATIPATTARIKKTGVSMLASIARILSSRVTCRKWVLLPNTQDRKKLEISAPLLVAARDQVVVQLKREKLAAELNQRNLQNHTVRSMKL
jgi:hypothetical protein